ncbi:hypothetical protein [Peristeroidobacter soli]|jgi:hypothetical protein|uniref:hypothetical protein n=1 Tax=Peristeroidobacter soli TaxID=2497877 RepID=UPI0013009D6A|nr:hypothetical protein [Peristeroidobacter soli]
MNAQRCDVIELLDFGDVTEETRQIAPSLEFPDHIFGRGRYPGFLEGAADRPVELSHL